LLKRASWACAALLAIQGSPPSTSSLRHCLRLPVRRWLGIAGHPGQPTLYLLTAALPAAARAQMAKLPADVRARGVITSSAGNHAQGVALAASRMVRVTSSAFALMC